jgi:aspartate/methionine/tyrosine aminotransferase
MVNATQATRGRPCAPARRLDGVKPSVMNSLLLRAKALREDGRQVIDLAAGAPLFPPPANLLQAAGEAVAGGYNSYGDVTGVQGLRYAQAHVLRQRSGVDYHPETEVTVTAGASSALQAVLLALCNAGDGVAMFEPFYEAFLPLIKLAGGKPKFVRLHAPHWSFSEKELDRALSGRTRFLLLNTPHNPTGRVFTKHELEMIARLCAQRGIIVIADETYEPYVFNGHKHISIASVAGMRDLAILIHSASKVYNVPGWRIGTIAAPEHLSKPIRQVNAMSLGAPIPLQYAMIQQLTSRDYGKFVESLPVPYAPLMRALCDALSMAGFSATYPQGTLSLMAGAGYWSQTATTSAELSEVLLKHFSILSVPGDPFYNKSPKEALVRFSFARDSKTIDAAVASLAKVRV